MVSTLATLFYSLICQILLAPQPYKIVITRFFLMLHFKLLRKIHGTNNQFFGMCASINDKNCNYKPYKSFIVQSHLLILWKKNTGKKFVTQGKLRENTGNFISVGTWPPCFWSRLVQQSDLSSHCGVCLFEDRWTFYAES